MRKRTITSSASALLLFIASFVSAKHGVHENLEAIHKRHRVNREIAARSTAEDAELGVEIRAIPETTTDGAGLDKRQAQCAFPTDAGLVSVTPGDANAGWAMSPDQPCTPGNYCPYACPAGQVSMQWDPTATSYSYPKSMVSSGPADTWRTITDARDRMAGYSAMQTATFRNRFPTGHTASRQRPISGSRTTPEALSPFARPCFRATKPC